MDVSEAIAIEEERNRHDRERKARAEAKREKQEKLSMPTRETKDGRRLTREEYEQKVWAFMNYKPTDSDMEGEDEDDDDFDDPDDDGTCPVCVHFPCL